jgi:hypothetical protein
MKRLLKTAAATLVVLVPALAVLLRVRYGGGQPYPDLNTPPLLPESALEVVVEHPEPIGNVAVDRDGRLFFTVHPESRPERLKLLEWRDGRARPYPSDQAQERLDTPLGVTIDSKQRLWVVDHGTHGLRSRTDGRGASWSAIPA